MPPRPRSFGRPKRRPARCSEDAQKVKAEVEAYAAKVKGDADAGMASTRVVVANVAVAQGQVQAGFAESRFRVEDRRRRGGGHSNEGLKSRPPPEGRDEPRFMRGSPLRGS